MDKLSDFIKEIELASQRFFPDTEIQIKIVRASRLNIRILLPMRDLYLDIFYNVDTERKDFALIWKNRRIFGFDNLGGWHFHPYESPEQHVPSPEPSVETVFLKISQILKKTMRH